MCTNYGYKFYWQLHFALGIVQDLVGTNFSDFCA